MKLLCSIAVAGMLLTGCKNPAPESEGGEGKRDEAPKPPRVATLYVESKGEPVNSGGKKIETADSKGAPTGSFGAKDLLMPGMTLLISGVTAAGGALLVRALDKKDRPSGPVFVESGGSDSSYVPVDSGGGTGPAPGTEGTTPAPGAEPAPPDPGTISGVASTGEKPGDPGVASGVAVVATRSEILLAMDFAAHFTGPAYVSWKSASKGVGPGVAGTWVRVYQWELTIDRSAVKSGETVDVYVTIEGAEGLPRVAFRLFLPDGARFVCDHTPLSADVTESTIATAWYSWTWSLEPWGGSGTGSEIGFPTPPEGTRVKLGYIEVTRATDVVGVSIPFVLTKP